MRRITLMFVLVGFVVTGAQGLDAQFATSIVPKKGGLPLLEGDDLSTLFLDPTEPVNDPNAPEYDPNNPIYLPGKQFTYSLPSAIPQWSITGNLPNGLSSMVSPDNPLNFLIVGTVGAGTEGVYEFNLSVDDDQGNSASLDVTTWVSSGTTPLSVATASLPDAQVAFDYSASIQVVGGIMPYQWKGGPNNDITGITLANHDLPPSMFIKASADKTALEVFGTPTLGEEGTYTVHVSVADDDSDLLDNMVTAPSTTTIQLSFDILPPGAMVVNQSLATLPAAAVGEKYTLVTINTAKALLDVQGGSGNYNVKVAGANGTSLPSGLSLQGISFSGTPTSAGDYDVQFRVEDANDPAKFFTTGAMKLKVYPALNAPHPFALEPAYVTYGYTSSAPAVSGLTGQYVFSSSGFIPAGLTLDPSDGSISGIVQELDGAVNLSVLIEDKSFPEWNVTVTYQFTILPEDQAPTPLTIVTSSLPDGEEGEGYVSVQFDALGGVLPYNWSSTSGMPSGMTVSSSGILSGTPVIGSAVQTNVVSLTVIDGIGDQASVDLSLNILPAGTTIDILTTSLPFAQEAEFYTADLVASSADDDFIWSVASLPSGLGVWVAEDGTWQIFGVPKLGTAGNHTVTLNATNREGGSATESVQLSINTFVSSNPIPVAVATIYLPPAFVGQSYGPIALSATGGSGVIDFGKSAGFPAGLVLNQQSDKWFIVGTPLEGSDGMHDVALVASDASLETDIAVVELQVVSKNTPVVVLDPEIESAQQALSSLIGGAPAGCALATSVNHVWSMLVVSLLLLLSLCGRRYSSMKLRKSV